MQLFVLCREIMQQLFSQFNFIEDVWVYRGVSQSVEVEKPSPK